MTCSIARLQSGEPSRISYDISKITEILLRVMWERYLVCKRMSSLSQVFVTDILTSSQYLFDTLFGRSSSYAAHGNPDYNLRKPGILSL